MSFPTVLPHLPLTDRVKSLFLWGEQVSKSRAGDWLARPGSARLHLGYTPATVLPRGSAFLKFTPSSLPGATPHPSSPRAPLEPTPWFQEQNPS